MMTPAMQRVAAVLLVGVALMYLGRRAWRAYATARAAHGPGCGDGCGCGH